MEWPPGRQETRPCAVVSEAMEQNPEVSATSKFERRSELGLRAERKATGCAARSEQEAKALFSHS